MRKIKNTCIIETVWGLLLYLLVCKEEDFDRTLFFGCETSISNGISRQLSHVVKIPNVRIHSNWASFRLRVKATAKWHIYRTHIFAQDHLNFSSQLIGLHKYTLIEDAPRIYSRYTNEKAWVQMANKKKTKGHILTKICRGSILFNGEVLGQNRQCKNRWVSDEQDMLAPILDRRKCTHIDIEKEWIKSSEQKQNRIKKIFGITEHLLAQCQKAHAVFLTQPFSTDFHIPEEQLVEYYRPFLENYLRQGLIIKPHPRDYIAYERYFPTATVLQTQAPMQLLGLIGVDFSVAITTQSTSISLFPQTTNIVRIPIPEFVQTKYLSLC